MKTFIYNFPKLHHSSPNSFGANGHLRQKDFKTGKVIERSRDVTPRSKVEKSKGRPRSPCAPNMVQFRPLFPELRHFEKNGTRHFFRSAAILKVLVGPNWFFLQLSWSQHKLAHSCQGRGQRSNGAINRNKHLFRSFCRGISNLVTPSITVAELFQKEGMK